MPTDAEREEIIRQLLQLLDEIAEDSHSSLATAKVSIAKKLVRQLASPQKPDGA